MQPVQTSTDVVYHPILQLRRTLKPELDRLESMLTNDWKDELSELLVLWLKNFKECIELRTVDYEQVLTAYITHLENILRLNPPLDEETMLGSDNQVYGKKFLCLHRANSQEPYSKRSPIFPNDPRPFMVRAHVPVREIIHFVKRYRPNFCDPKINQLFDALPEDKKILDETVPAIQKIRLDLYERNLKRKGHSDAQEKFKALVDQVFIPQVQALRTEIARNHVERQKEIEEVQKNFSEEENILKEKLRIVDSSLQKLNVDIGKLKNEQQHVKNQISEAEKENVKLQIAIKETEKALKEREKGWFKDLITLVAVVAASWAATWVLGEIVASMGSIATPTIQVMRGGLRGGLAIPI